MGAINVGNKVDVRSSCIVRLQGLCYHVGTLVRGEGGEKDGEDKGGGAEGKKRSKKLHPSVLAQYIVFHADAFTKSDPPIPMLTTSVIFWPL